MPPKRKRAAADAAADSSTSTRPVRRSSRTTRGKNGASNVADKAGISHPVESPAPKKTKTTGTRTTKARGTRASGASIDDEPLNSTTSQQPSNDELDMHQKAPTPQPNVPSAKLGYSQQRAQALFKNYADSDDPDVIGPAGIEKLCTEAGIPLEGAQPLILAWQFKAQEMAKVSRSEWLHGTDALRISSLQMLALSLKELDDLVIQDKEPITPDSSISSMKKREGNNLQDPYNRVRYWQYASDRNTAFSELYQFSFTLSKPSQSRNLDIETAMALWSVLLVPRYPIITKMIEFLNGNGSYKGANKDIWNMVHEFCRTIDGDLSNYEADGAWPTMLDDFAEWKRGRAAGSADGEQGR